MLFLTTIRSGHEDFRQREAETRAALQPENDRQRQADGDAAEGVRDQLVPARSIFRCGLHATDYINRR